MAGAPVPLTPLERKERARKLHRYAIITGIVIALFCKLLPHAYQLPCTTLVKLCSGGL